MITTFPELLKIFFPILFLKQTRNSFFFSSADFSSYTSASSIFSVFILLNWDERMIRKLYIKIQERNQLGETTTNHAEKNISLVLGELLVVVSRSIRSLLMVKRSKKSNLKCSFVILTNRANVFKNSSYRLWYIQDNTENVVNTEHHEKSEHKRVVEEELHEIKEH